MLRLIYGLLASVGIVAASGTAALAGNTQQCAGGQQSGMEQPGLEQPGTISQEERMDEVAGVRIVPSILAKDVPLTPQHWMVFSPASRNATAAARVFANRQGEITGLTITAWGLPNPERINPRYSDYVVWLVNSQTNEMRNLGPLESRNGGEAVFGYTPEVPMRGFDRLVITPEPTFATRWPSGWEQLTGDVSVTAMAPQQMPGSSMPMQD